jgi:hypothetical protein
MPPLFTTDKRPLIGGEHASIVAYWLRLLSGTSLSGWHVEHTDP